MSQGLLEVDGTIDVLQFWPDGEADADTTKVIIDVSQNAFRFRPHEAAPFQPTNVFADAQVRGRVTSDVIKNGRMTVRLEGIDAPELHYVPAALLKKAQRTAEQHKLYLEWNLKYRQYLGETATTALADLLGQVGPSPIPCLVSTAVDEPNQVFDTYGRFVGYLKVTVGGQQVIVNDWLTRQGWTFPAFYSSMLDHEIISLTAAADAAWYDDLGVWEYLHDDTDLFDFALIYRKKNAMPDPAADLGPVVFPKLFRRIAEYRVNKRAKMFSGSFRKFLERKNEYCFDVEDFLLQGSEAATPVPVAELIDSAGMFLRWPEQVVFKEAPSLLLGPGNVPITAW